MRKFDPKKIKALAIDLDGTILLPNTTLGERTKFCIKKLISKGMEIIIATGRAIEASERFRSAMGAEGPMVYFNGAEVVDMPSGKILHTNLIGKDVVDFGTDIARSLGIHYQVYLPAGISPETGKPDVRQKWEALLIEKFGPDAQMYKNHTGIEPVIKDLKSVAALPDLKGFIKGMFIADPSLHDEIRQRIFERFGDRISVMRSFPTFLEVINNGVSKGEGLKIVMEYKGLKPEEVIAFGDEENDLPMFSAAGFAAAPENARVNIQKEADLVYGSNADEGLAEYLEGTFLYGVSL
ncbi:MAG: Cof-type HAD-IIB family hydrolase [Treponema sp.]|jgi:Cof subfamily protein (haloacid dehalogenase superfamily)|nr:Cof-type HAD-IIB family hydrolase [Treponema sp.]